MTEHVAIIGCGFSGALQAINLHRHGGPRATLIERREKAGEGVAYGAAHPTHLLNVRAARMSAFPDDEDHFVRWLKSRGVAKAEEAFIPRTMYGEYLREILERERQASGGRLVVVHDEVADVTQQGDGARLRLASGGTIDADAAILAVGNLPPHSPPGLDDERLAPPLYIADPWSGAATAGLGDDDTVLIVGTGLTMVDMALLLDTSGFRGRIVAISRRGLLPHRHAPSPPPPGPLSERPPIAASQMVRTVRARAREIGWRNAVDELRPFTQAMWRAASEEERLRFLRHLRPWWDIHRHRIAPEVADRLERMRREGRLEVRGGRPLAFQEVVGEVAVTWRPRGAKDAEVLRVQRVINCTGPQGDLLRASEPLLKTLLARGLIRPDAHRLGIDVDSQARTVAADGSSNEWLFALGPMTRGAFWEIVAVPDIRTQTWAVARKLSNAHWVGGEGL